MTDIVERAKAALEAPDDGRHGFCDVCGEYVGDADDPVRTLVPELVAEVQRLRGLLDHYEPRIEMCQACGGLGQWETECCNGVSGCPCRGGLVDMGRCHACGGTGQVEQQRPMANANFILHNNIGYPGGGPR